MDIIAGSFVPSTVNWYENPGKEKLRLGQLWKEHLLVDTKASQNEGQLMADINGDGIPEWLVNSWGKDTPLPDPFPNSIYNRGRQITGGMFLEWAAIPNGSEKDMADTKRVNWACDVLKQKHDRLFFLAVGLYAPHFPNYVPKKYFDLYE